jgi:hypothetical protein
LRGYRKTEHAEILTKKKWKARGKVCYLLLNLFLFLQGRLCSQPCRIILSQFYCKFARSLVSNSDSAPPAAIEKNRDAHVIQYLTGIASVCLQQETVDVLCAAATGVIGKNPLCSVVGLVCFSVTTKWFAEP